MSAASSQSNQLTEPVLTKVKVEGGARVQFGLSENKTVLRDLYQRDPVRILFPDNPPGELTIGVLTTTSGGLVGGDVISIKVHAEAETQAMIMAQAAEKIYRSAGDDCLIDITIKADDGAWFEWLPQETILHHVPVCGGKRNYICPVVPAFLRVSFWYLVAMQWVKK